jgi:UDP-2,3-diacylglucosamine pyrophosphatase LpxH
MYGPLDQKFSTIVSGKKIIAVCKPGFQLDDGCWYRVTLGQGIRSTSGLSLQSETEIEIRTRSLSLFMDNDTTPRNSIVCISDIHLGDARAVNHGYCWFSRNAAALENLLDSTLASKQVRQLAILGDLFDEWIIPYRFSPFDTSAGVYNTRDYFLSVANSPVNHNIIDKFKAIAASGKIQLVYVPGNHDMLLTRDILQEIIPGIIWQGDSAGMGSYSPVNEMIMEHGHRYDFFNCPQPYVNPGHILPPGFFISRLDAQGTMDHGSSAVGNLKSGQSELEFLAAWTTAYTYLVVKHSMTVAADSANIKMSGVDSYNSAFSFHGARDMYAANIEDVWPSTQHRNAVPVTMPVLMAILNGNSDLYYTAGYEYMDPPSPKKYKLVAFGHTHKPMIEEYPKGKKYTGIYANTGTWVNAELSDNPVRTYLVIKPGAWNASDLDVVSLYQYNLESGSPVPSYIPVLLDEESIAIAK